MVAASIQTGPPRWVHAWALLTVVATLPLLFLGATVTTLDAGMSDPVGFRWPLELIQLFNEATGLGLRIEYAHRLMGMVVGLLVIGLAAALWFTDPRRAVRWAGVLAIALVVTQGMIGKYRVDLNALFGRSAALVHGCFAQIVIAVLVSLVLFTSRTWLAERDTTESSETTPALRRWALLTVLAIYAQLVLGGMVRHTEFLLGPRGHLIGAFVVLALILGLARLVYEQTPHLRRPLNLLLALVAVQLLLGVETWLSRFFVPAANLPQLRPASIHADAVRSIHYVVGTMIFATSVVLTLRACRRTALVSAPHLTTEPPISPGRGLEGAL